MILGAFFLLAIWLDPSEPSRYAGFTYAILSIYFGYATILAAVAWRRHTSQGRAQVVAHAVDMMVFAIVMFFTEGPTSPFFVYFVFLLVCATLRWHWRGTLWTALAALVIVIAMAFYPTDLLGDPRFDLNRFIIRVVYLAVVAILLGYLGAYEQRLRSDVSNLAEWPHFIPAELKTLLQEMLKKVATILDAPSVVLAWEAEEEPWVHLASWRGGEFHYSREAPAVFGSLVPKPLTGRNFFCANARSPQPTVVHNSPEGFRRWRGSPLHPQLLTCFNPKSVLGLRLHGKNQEGYLFAFEKRGISSDDLVLGEVVSSGVSVRLDNFFLLKQLLGTAAMKERIRLARDLHDGLLQSLSGAGLQMEAVRRLMETDPQPAQKLLLEIQQLIAAEQQDLRLHIRELKPSVSNFREKDPGLAARLGNLAERIKRHFGLHVDVGLSHHLAEIPANLAQEIYFIIHESVINAARHANASKVRAELGVEDNRVNITVSDDGHGFPFRGRYDHAALTKNGLGPANLKERISSLGGSLVLDSSDSGTRLEIEVPIKESEV